MLGLGPLHRAPGQELGSLSAASPLLHALSGSNFKCREPSLQYEATDMTKRRKHAVRSYFRIRYRRLERVRDHMRGLGN